MGRFPIAQCRVRRKVVAPVLMLLAAACGDGGPASARGDDPAAEKDRATAEDAQATMAMGTNLDGLAYWNTALPTLDIMKSAGVWLPQAEGVYDTGEVIELDRDGWPVMSTHPDMRRYRSVLVNVLHDNTAAPPSARYVVLYEGEGAITALDIDGAQVLSSEPGELRVLSGRSGGLYLRIDASGAPLSRSIRNIRVVREEYLPLYRAGLTFNPEMLARINAFQVLRFMDWMNTNALFGPTGGPITGDTEIGRAPQLDWKDRPRLTSMRWGDGSRGVPVEALVEIANRTGAEPWFTMPVNASDDYVRGFAGYVRANLRPGLKIHVELSNEVWNWMFPQARYAQAQARAAFGADANWLEWYGMRAAQVGMIWKQVFGQPVHGSRGSGRVSMVFGTQFAWRGLEANGLETKHWRNADGKHLRAADYFDEYAITAYYDGTMNTDETVGTVRGWWKDADGGYARAVAALAKRIAEFNAPLYRYHAEQAEAHGMRLVSYESGFGEYTPISQHDNDAYTDFLVKLQRRPELFALETANYHAFAKAGGRLFMNFGIIGAPSKWGSWSALESVQQASSPRYDALMAWLKRNPPAPAPAPHVAFADARITIAKKKGGEISDTEHGYDVLIGSNGNDRFVAGRGPGSWIVGGGGTDTLLLQHARASYRFKRDEGSNRVLVEGPNGRLTFSEMAFVQFGSEPAVVLDDLVSEKGDVASADAKRIAGVPAPK